MCVLPKADVRFFALVIAVAAILPLGTGVRAESCLPSAAGLPQSEIAALLAQPEQLLTRFPRGGPALSARVQRLVLSDTKAAPVLIELARNAEPSHQVAISIGLGRAAARCTKKRPDLAEALKKLMAEVAPASMRALFLSEAIVTALAPGSPAEAGLSAAADVAGEIAETGVLPPESATLDAIGKARPPTLIFRAGFDLPRGREADARTTTPPTDLGGVQAPSYQGDVASAPVPPETGDEGILGPVPTAQGHFAFGRPPFALGGPDQDASLDDEGKGNGKHTEAPWNGDHDFSRWSHREFAGSFGNGGVLENSQRVISPSR